MKQENLFTVAGTSALNGEVKVRFANDLVSRIKALHRSGHTDVNLVELPKAMTKLEALQYLQAQGITEGEAGYAVSAKVAEKVKAAKKGEVKVAGASLKPTAKTTAKVAA
jgi:uncharacterized protein YoaH (UPF0181 family)